MIENIRKYTGLIFVVIVLLLLGFIFMDTRNLRRSIGGGAPVVTVDGIGYSQSDVVTKGSAPLRLAYSMLGRDANALEIMRYTNTLVGGAQEERNAELQFFSGRLILQQAAEEFGVHPSDDQISAFIRELSAFQNPTALGQAGDGFSQETFNLFVQKRLPSLNLNEADFRDLVRDVIAYREIRDLVGGGLSGSRQTAEAMAVVNAQKITADYASLDVAKLKEDIKPTEDELKAYWEPLKESFQTEERVKVSYALIAPQYPDDLPEEAVKPAADETDEQRQQRETAETQRQDGRKAVEKKLADAVSQFIDHVYDTEGADFENLIKENGWELQSTDWITSATLPADFNLPTRGISAQKSVAPEVFALTLGPDPLAPFSEPLAVGKNQWFVARLDALEEPREKTFEEAREEVLKSYIDEKADEAAKKLVEEKLAAMKADVEAGKTFKEAAEAQDLEPQSIGPFSQSEPVPGETASHALFAQAATVKPGDFAEPLYTGDRALIVRVTQREIVKDDNRGTQIDSYTSNLQIQNETFAFQAWLDARIQDAQVSTVQ
ncbi:hypothetical protein HNR46_003583 [Haloferula luteola]|uniref:PpiC domain-containing protein n=1 Tax=Haloferula luteola TaxID=595692 RepID=A0A840V4Y2_9BACT|nr:SurA N-terminal domain-containing protein [Haloferula luteola]MBB5353327.1 hypothetical protein [Haloferula luteola]